MKCRGDIQPSFLNISSLHSSKQSLPKSVQTPLLHQNRSTISANTYEKLNHCDAVWQCTHLTVRQCKDLIELFNDYKELFDGTLGKIPGKPVSFTLKPDAKPYCSR
eukprot:10555395-Ditylum_brightwellii.AAC.1